MTHCAAVTGHQYAAHHTARPIVSAVASGGQWWPVVASVPGIISIHIVIVPLPILGHPSTPDTLYSHRRFWSCSLNLWDRNVSSMLRYVRQTILVEKYDLSHIA